MAFYPRKQTLAIFILCAFAVGGTAYYTFGQEKGQNTPTSASEEVSAAPYDYLTSVDSDWRESFLKTVNEFAASADTAAISQSPITSELTATDKLGRSFFGKYLELRQHGALEDDVAVSYAIGESLAEATAGISMPRIYSADEISITSNNAGTITNYGKIIDSILRDYSSKGDEASIALEAFEKQNTEILSKIDPVIKRYEDLIARLISTPVPEPLANNHLSLINGLSAGLYSSKAFREIDTNPLQAIIGVRINLAADKVITSMIISIQAGLASSPRPTSS